MNSQVIEQSVDPPAPRIAPLKHRKAHPWAWFFLAPAMLILLSFDYWPLVLTFFLSTQGTDLFGRPSGFVGLENFELMLSSPGFWNTLLVTFLYTAGSVIGKLLIGLAIAVPLSGRLRGTALLRSFVLIPMAVSVAVAALVFKMMFQPGTGLFDQLAGAFGAGPAGWLTQPQMALLAVVIVDIWCGIGITVLLLLAALDRVPEEVLEASEIDGTHHLQRLWHVKLPLITPTLFFILITQSIAGMREFTIINMVTGGGPGTATNTLVIDIYKTAFGSGTGDYGAAAARGLVLLLIIVTLTFIQMRGLERRVHY